MTKSSLKKVEIRPVINEFFILYAKPSLWELQKHQRIINIFPDQKSFRFATIGFRIMKIEISKWMRLLKSTRFVNVSVNSQVKETMAITPRQCEVLYRLSEASVRARLSDKVTVNDVKRVITIFGEYLHWFDVDHGAGKFDVDIIIESGNQPQPPWTHATHCYVLIRTLDKGTWVKEEDALKITLDIYGLYRNKTEESLQWLIENRVIFRPGLGHYKVV